MSSAQCFWFILLLQVIDYSKPCADIVFVLDGSGSVKQQFKVWEFSRIGISSWKDMNMQTLGKSVRRTM